MQRSIRRRNNVRILYGKDDEVFDINYCPMCGRRLEDGRTNK